MQNTNSPNVSLISLGCPKTLVDSEKILGQIAESGGLICEEIDDADVIVINTCSFIEEAISESLDVIYEAVERKMAGECKAIIVSGCLSQRFGKKLKSEIPEVDVWVGVDEENKIAGICKAVAEEKLEHCAQLSIDRTKAPLESHAGRLRITPRHFAYLKISEGCDNVCAFCIIPKIRGRHRTKPKEVVIEEARELAQDGVVELVIIGQDTTDYGKDLYQERNLSGLLNELATVDGIRWMRLLYAFPAHFGDELIETMATNDRICKYLDIPIQHINQEMLRRMRREAGRQETEQLIYRLRERIPEIILRTSVIIGFPGETDKQFEELVEFLKIARFDRLGAFRYSQEEGTAGYRYEDQVPEEVKQDRLNYLMEVQQEIASEKNQERIGSETEILIDRRNSQDRNLWEGRSYGEAPEIDGLIYVQGNNLKIGEFCPVKIISTKGYDLIAEPLSKQNQLATSKPFPILSQDADFRDSDSLIRPRRL